jgi:hypothetical protein
VTKYLIEFNVREERLILAPGLVLVHHGSPKYRRLMEVFPWDEPEERGAGLREGSTCKQAGGFVKQ